MLDIKKKIKEDRLARKLYIDPDIAPCYDKVRGKKQNKYLNQFQRSKKISHFQQEILKEISKNNKFLSNRYFYDICLYGVKIKMNIPVLYEDDNEGEFDVEFCCSVCAHTSYGWSVEQFGKVYDMAKKGEPIKISSSVKTENDFIKFVKTL